LGGLLVISLWRSWLDRLESQMVWGVFGLPFKAVFVFCWKDPAGELWDCLELWD